MTSPPTGGREPKRTRQACINCRRKKTRCSGERPSCSYCLRLGQQCRYQEHGFFGQSSAQLPSVGLDNLTSSIHALNQNLATRVALLESRLGMHGSDLVFDSNLDANGITLTDPGFSAPTGTDKDEEISRIVENSTIGSGSAISSAQHDMSRKFRVVPSQSVLRAAADVYFSRCQNQPYSYFNEVAFRERLEKESFPKHLLLAFMATIARFSSDQFFEGSQILAMETYSRTAWVDILKQAMTSDLEMDIHTVQATNMLAVVDFTAGKQKLGWTKIGFSVRFAQALKLNVEPDPLLPTWQQEEHRRVFWSVYLLDKLVSCGRSHTPTIQDASCTVNLPCSEANFRTQLPEDTPTLQVLYKLPDVTACLKLDYFAQAVLAASVLGRVISHTLQRGAYTAFPPWDSRSDYAKMMSLLLSLEQILTRDGEDYTAIITSKFQTASGNDTQRAGHFIWSRCIHQLCHCLLTHPYLMRQRLKPYGDIFPRSFLRETSRRCFESAAQLTSILNTLKHTDCCARGSSLGYFAVVAGTIHQIYTHSKNTSEALSAQASLDACLEFLEDGPAQWQHYPRMAAALKDLALDPFMAQAFVNYSLPVDDSVLAESDRFWCMLDYAWLCDINRSLTTFSPLSFPDVQPLSWNFFEDLVGGEVTFPELL